MARILFYGQPGSLGHVYPAMPVLAELRRREHETFACVMAASVSLVQSEGHQARAVDPALEQLVPEDWRARTRLGALLSILDLYATRAPHEAADLGAAIDAYRPDAVIVDSVCFGAAARAEASGLPWVLFAPHLLPLPSRQAPPFGPALKPARGAPGRARDAAIRAAIDAAYRRPLKSLNRLRLALGVAPLQRGTDHYARPPLTLCASAPEFDYPHPDWPETVRMIGPCIWEPQGQPSEPVAATAAKLVLVAQSTDYQADESLLESALQGLGDGEFSVAASTGGADPPRSVPSGAIVRKYLPHSALLEHAACVVCHGGMGITQKALAAGVPVCVVPFGRDQPEVAIRVERANAGVVLAARRLTPQRLRRSVEQAIAMRPGAERTARSMRALDGGVLGANAIDALIAGSDA